MRRVQLAVAVLVGCVPAVVAGLHASETATVYLGSARVVVVVGVLGALTVANPVRVAGAVRPIPAWLLTLTTAGCWLWMVLSVARSESSTASIAYWIGVPILVLAFAAPWPLQQMEAERRPPGPGES